MLVKLLKVVRKVYERCGLQVKRPQNIITSPEDASIVICEALSGTRPVMIARFGSVELNILVNYLGVKNVLPRHIVGYIKNQTPPWWWETGRINHFQQNAGFFPATTEKVETFCESLLRDIGEVDILGSWRPEEHMIKNYLSSSVAIDLELLNPFFASKPWTHALEGKKVVVIHPFANTIHKQYPMRDLIFPNSLLPHFDLKVIKAVQTLAGEATAFRDWFQALDFMKDQIDSYDYDICLIGAGAYGFSLAAHVKRRGKKAIHLGGALQLLFGIRGKRWENPNYNPFYNYAALMNEYWVRPAEEERPKNASIVEGACYW